MYSQSVAVKFYELKSDAHSRTLWQKKTTALTNNNNSNNNEKKSNKWKWCDYHLYTYSAHTKRNERREDILWAHSKRQARPHSFIHPFIQFNTNIQHSTITKYVHTHTHTVKSLTNLNQSFIFFFSSIRCRLHAFALLNSFILGLFDR